MEGGDEVLEAGGVVGEQVDTVRRGFAEVLGGVVVSVEERGGRERNGWARNGRHGGEAFCGAALVKDRARVAAILSGTAGWVEVWGWVGVGWDGW